MTEKIDIKETKIPNVCFSIIDEKIRETKNLQHKEKPVDLMNQKLGVCFIPFRLLLFQD